jgi:prevent-host-death family protein
MRTKPSAAAGAISAAHAREHLAEVINRVAYAKDRVILTRRSKALAAMVPMEDVALLEEIEDREDLKAARAALREVKRKGTIPWTRLKKELRLDS